MEIHAEDFEQGVRKALADKNLQEGLATFGLFLPVLRKQAAENLPEFEALRDRGVEIKNKVLANLDFYLEQFEQSVERNGGRVHFARDGAEANRIIEGICEDAENKTIIKSKSMVTEELELNHHLEANGYEIFETDLGEYIIQLRDERPSHIVGPALHLDKDQVADTFHEHHQKYGHETRKDTAEELVQEARSVLREPFRNASIGITGANFVVSETGTIILVTNEGNADLSANMPKKHIVVTGIEKVLPTLEDASLYLRLLARSATGQDTSNYTSFFTGPKRKGDEDGPESFDVVLVDNGRSNLLGTEFQDMLRCLRCGSCLNHCPVYLTAGGHSYGSVYTGPMGSVLTPAFTSISQAAKLPNASTFCGRCETVCPSRIPLPKMMRHWREKEFEQHLTPPVMRSGLSVWAWLTVHPRAYRFVTEATARALHLFGHHGWIKKLPFFAKGWTQERQMAVPEKETFLAQWAKKGGGK